MQPRRSSIVPAVLLIAVGVIFLLVNLNVIPRVSIVDLWPALPALIGLGMLLQFFLGRLRDPGLVTGGTIFLLIGLFFFLFTLEVNVPGLGVVRWGMMAELWPAFPLIVAIALLLQWIAGGLRDTGLLVPVTILGIVGLAGFAFTLDRFPAFSAIVEYWPVLLIVLGLVVLARSFSRPRSTH